MSSTLHDNWGHPKVIESNNYMIWKFNIAWQWIILGPPKRLVWLNFGYQKNKYGWNQLLSTCRYIFVGSGLFPSSTTSWLGWARLKTRYDLGLNLRKGQIYWKLNQDIHSCMNGITSICFMELPEMEVTVVALK